MSKKKIEEMYDGLELREQILLRPDTYVGSIQPVQENIYIVNDLENLSDIKLSKNNITFIPAFIKIFDEVITNASDHVDRCKRDSNFKDSQVTYIKVRIEDNKISVENDGTGIPIENHSKFNMYVPELIFGRLLSGSNYNDNQERYGGGRNGYGAKLTNIFSKKFIVETSDGKQKYKQVFKNNMSEVGKPEIVKSSTPATYTLITFYPDFDRFGMNGMNDELLKFLYKRVIDIAAFNPDIKVSLNGKLIHMKSLKDYMKMHLDPEADFFYEKLNDYWEIGVAQSTNDGFEQVSIVNGITTYKGGTHVNRFALRISQSLETLLTKGNKGLKIKWTDIKNKLFVFLVAKVPNPIFDSQTKEFLSTPMTNEVLKGAEPSEAFLKKISKSEIVQTILDYIALKEQQELAKLSRTKGKTAKIKVEKLDDAIKAGTEESEKCYLILTEGDSAKSMAISGMSEVGRDYFGAYPLRGKVQNVRGIAPSKLIKEFEKDEKSAIINIITILGLVPGKNYSDKKELRYGKVVLMTDQDHDGTHIKGLLINLFHSFWPELLKMNYLWEFITPIAKATKGKEVKTFYRFKEYNDWKETNPSGYSIKYYKGLGTNSAKESKEYFKNIDKHLVPFKWNTDAADGKIDLVFSNVKGASNKRKDWLLQYKGDTTFDKFGVGQTYEEFIDNEMIQFSMSDNVRSIPSLFDGLKPSLRKILYASLKTLKSEEKVAELTGSVLKLTAYHHNPNSLSQGIVGLAQDFVGSNNLNLLMPNGQFGTRIYGGKDSAADRYIFTDLNHITRFIFKSEDDNILNYLDDDGKQIEPEYYIPIIPMVLVNGAEGIGTGWSTDIPKYNPKDLVRVLENKLNGKKSNSIHPWYNSFKGKILKTENGYVSQGVYEIVNTTKIKITELPIGVWTDNYLITLDKLIEKKFIKDYTNRSSEVSIEIIIDISRENLADLTDAQLIKKLSLESSLPTTNMNLFVDNKITLFETPEQIIDVFYQKRLSFYQYRKDYLIDILEKSFKKLDNLVRFILAVIDGEIIINNQKKDSIIKNLEKMKFEKIDDSYNYLLNIPVYSLTKEKVEEYKQLKKDKASELKTLKSTDIKDLWLKDLEELKKQL